VGLLGVPKQYIKGRGRIGERGGNGEEKEEEEEEEEKEKEEAVVRPKGVEYAIEEMSGVFERLWIWTSISSRKGERGSRWFDSKKSIDVCVDGEIGWIDWEVVWYKLGDIDEQGSYLV